MAVGGTPPGPARSEVAARLEARRGELEQAVLNRVYAISDPTEAADPAYMEGLRAAVSAAIEYGLGALERGEERTPPVPVALLAQARLAARNRVGLDTVLRRYFAGHAILDDFLIEAAEGDRGVRGGELKRMMRTQATLFNRLLAAVGAEYQREAENRPISPEQRLAELVEKLLEGEVLDASGLAYELEAQHLGAIASGPAAERALGDLAKALDRRPLIVPRSEGTVWAWLGARRPVDMEQLARLLSDAWPAGLRLALGEPAAGLTGWRLTHRQAAAALPVAVRGPDSVARYRDVALVASALRDDLLATSLRGLYLEPLEAGRDGGETARETLRAYFAAGNVSSSAAALGVRRHTVSDRLREVEAKLGRSLSACAAELELALRLDELTDPSG